MGSAEVIWVVALKTYDNLALKKIVLKFHLDGLIYKGTDRRSWPKLDHESNWRQCSHGFTWNYSRRFCEFTPLVKIDISYLYLVIQTLEKAKLYPSFTQIFLMVYSLSSKRTWGYLFNDCILPCLPRIWLENECISIGLIICRWVLILWVVYKKVDLSFSLRCKQI